MRNKKRKTIKDNHLRNHALYESVWIESEIAHGHMKVPNSKKLIEKMLNMKCS